jgi:hypothetical protein
MKSDWSQSKIIACNNASIRIMQLVFLRRREAMMVQRGVGGTILWDCVARRIAAIDHCHCPLLHSMVVFGRESRVKKIEL